MARRVVFACNLFNVSSAYVLRRFFTEMMIPSHLIEPFASLPQGDLLLSDDALRPLPRNVLRVVQRNLRNEKQSNHLNLFFLVTPWNNFAYATLMRCNWLFNNGNQTFIKENVLAFSLLLQIFYFTGVGGTRFI